MHDKSHSTIALPSDYKISAIDVQIPRAISTLSLIRLHNVKNWLPTCACSFMFHHNPYTSWEELPEHTDPQMPAVLEQKLIRFFTCSFYNFNGGVREAVIPPAWIRWLWSTAPLHQTAPCRRCCSLCQAPVWCARGTDTCRTKRNHWGSQEVGGLRREKEITVFKENRRNVKPTSVFCCQRACSGLVSSCQPDQRKCSRRCGNSSPPCGNTHMYWKSKS